MRNKILELLRLTRDARKQSVAMQHKLLLYWISMLLAIFAALLVVLSAMGVFSGTGQRLYRILEVHHKAVTVSLKEQVNILTASWSFIVIPLMTVSTLTVSTLWSVLVSITSTIICSTGLM